MTTMIWHEHDLHALEKQVHALVEEWELLWKIDFRQLIPIIKRPGWTTPAEYRFAGTLLHSLHLQVGQLSSAARDRSRPVAKLAAAKTRPGRHGGVEPCRSRADRRRSLLSVGPHRDGPCSCRQSAFGVTSRTGAG